ncbi:hypothetical protein [Nocardia sp. NBC_01329]|nr:hypothetical protein OG405_26140 [Nocardia sp. NBC_01329]
MPRVRAHQGVFHNALGAATSYLFEAAVVVDFGVDRIESKLARSAG